MGILLPLQFGPIGIELGQLALQGLDLALVAQVEVLGSHPQRAVPGNHLIAAQGFERLQLLLHRLVGGAQGGDLGPDRLLLTVDGLPLPHQGIGVRTHRTSARRRLVHPIQGGQQLALTHGIANPPGQGLHLACRSGVKPDAAVGLQQHRTALHLHGHARREGPGSTDRRHQSHRQQAQRPVHCCHAALLRCH